MVRGLRHFAEHFSGLEDCYVLIGGSACDLLMGDLGLTFRATQNLDLVLVVESLRQSRKESGEPTREEQIVEEAKNQPAQGAAVRMELRRNIG